MKYLPLGNSKLRASVVGLGTWVLGGGAIWGKDPDDNESIRTIQTALDLGVNLIDTAPAYGWGRSEEVIGRALHGRRSQAVIATKCGLWWEDERGSFFTELDGHKMRRSLRPDTIQIEIERSLRRLQTDYIDLYQTHWPATEPDNTPIADTIACLLKLKAQGKIRAIGVSNVSVEQLQENCRHAEIASDQLRYSMLSRDAEKDLLPSCRKQQIATLTYMSLEQGLLTGKIGMDHVFSKQEFRSNEAWNPWFLPQNRKRVLDLLDGWKDLTAQFNCTLAQLVTAWTLAQPGVTHVLCGSRKSQQIQETARAADLVLDEKSRLRMRRDVEALKPL